MPALIKVKLKKYTPQKKAHLLFEDVKKLLPELVGASMTKGSADPKSGGHNEPYEFRFDLELSGTLDQAKKRLYDTAQEIFFRNDRVVEVTHKLK